MRTICEEVNVAETFWPRQGEMIVVLLKAVKGTVASVAFQPQVKICSLEKKIQHNAKVHEFKLPLFSGRKNVSE